MARGKFKGDPAVVMKVVGIDLIKISATLNLKIRPVFSPAIWRSPATFFVDFDMEKKYVPLKIASGQNIVVWA